MKGLGLFDSSRLTRCFVTVNFVFNRRDGVGALDGPKLDAGEKCDGYVVALKETPEIAGNNSPQQLNNSKLHKNGNHVLEEEDTHAKQVLVKQGSLDGKHFSGFDVISSKNSETAGTALEERSKTGAENIGSDICEKKDKFKDIKLPVSQVLIGKGVKHARKSSDLDDAPSKIESNGVEGVKDSVGCMKDVKRSENSSPLDEKLSNTGFSLSKEASISGHAEDVVGLQKDSKSNENPVELQGKLSKANAMSSSEKEKLGSTHRKNLFGAHKDRKDGGNLRSCGEKTSHTNVVSGDVTQRPSTTNVSPKETPKSPPNKDFKGSEQIAKPAQSLSTSKKRPLEMTIKESKGKSNLEHDKSHENKEKKLGNSCLNGEGYTKKAKLDNSVKQSEESKNTTIKKAKEKTYLGLKKSPKIATCDNNAKAGAGEGPSKDHNEKEKVHVGKMKNSPKSLTCVDKAKSKFHDSSKENDNEKDGKLSNDNLPNRTKDDGGKVGGKIIEVTRRPPVS